MTIRRYAKRFRFVRFSKCVAVIAAFFLTGVFPFSANAWDILLGIGKTGTFSHFTGRTLCRIINRYSDDMTCKTVSAPHEMHNLTNLRGGSLDIALVDSRMLHDAFNQTGYFEFMDIRYDNLRTLVPLYEIPVTLVARNDANIASLNGLKGKRINAGAPGSLQHLAVETILKVKNWTRDDFSLFGELPDSQSQDTMAFCHGTIQAMVHIGVHPDASLQQLFQLCDAGLVELKDEDIEKMVKGHPALSEMTVAADIYPSQSGKIVTFGTKAMLVAPEGLDEDTVYQIVEIIYAHQNRLKSAHPALSPPPVNDAQTTAAGIPLHPGAAGYFSTH